MDSLLLNKGISDQSRQFNKTGETVSMDSDLLDKESVTSAVKTV